MSVLDAGRAPWLDPRLAAALEGAVLYVDDGAAESLKWCGGVEWALDTLGAHAVVALPTESPSVANAPSLAAVAAEAAGGAATPRRVVIVVTSYLWDIEAQLLTCLLRHAGTTDVLICCSLSAEAHASHPLANDLLQAQGQDDDADMDDNDDEDGGNEHGSANTPRSSAFNGQRGDRLDFRAFGRRLAQHSARLSGLDPAHLIAGLPGHPRVLVLYLPLHAVFALQQPTTPATAAAAAAAAANMGADAGSANIPGATSTHASASAAAGTLGWFTLTKSPATKAFPLQRWHVPESARQASTANSSETSAAGGTVDPVQSLRAVDVPPDRASTLKALADALAGCLMHQLKLRVGTRVFALGRTSELVGLRLGTRLRAMHTTDSNNLTATSTAAGAAHRSRESSSSSHSSAHDDQGSDETYAWSAAQSGGDATIVLVDRTQLFGGDGGSGAATTSHALSDGSALDALLACLPRASNSGAAAGAVGAAAAGNNSDVPAEAWAHDVAVEPPSAVSPSTHSALWPGPLVASSSSAALINPAGKSGDDHQKSRKAWLDDLIGQDKLPPASLCHPTNQAAAALLHALAAPAPPSREAQRGRKDGSGGNDNEEGKESIDHQAGTVLEGSGVRAVMAALSSAMARAGGADSPLNPTKLGHTGGLDDVVAHVEALLSRSSQTSNNNGSSGEDDHEGIMAVAVALIEAITRSRVQRSTAALSSRLSELAQRLAGNSGSDTGRHDPNGATTLSAPDTDVLLLDLEAGLSRAAAGIDTTTTNGSSNGVSLHDALLLLQQLSGLGPWTATETSFDGGYSEGYVALRRRLHGMLRARLDAIARQPSTMAASDTTTKTAGAAAADTAAVELWRWCGPWAPWAACEALVSGGHKSRRSTANNDGRDSDEGLEVAAAAEEEDEEDVEEEELAASAAAAALELEDALDDVLMRLSDLSQSCASLNSGGSGSDVSSSEGGGRDRGGGVGISSRRKVRSLPDFVGRLLAGPGSADAIGTAGLPIFQVGDGKLRPLPKPALLPNASSGGHGQAAEPKASASKSGGLFGSFNKGLALLQQAAAAAASLVPTGGEADADPAGSPTLVVFVVGGLAPSEAASVGAAVQAAWAMEAANDAMASEAAAHNIASTGDSASGKSKVVPRVLLGGSCLSSPSVLFSHICS